MAHQQGLGIVRDEKQEKTLVSELGRETIFKCAKFFGNDMKSRYSPFAKLVQKRLGVSDAYMDKHWNEWILKLLTSSVGTRRSTVTTAMRKEAIGKFFPCFFIYVSGTNHYLIPYCTAASQISSKKGLCRARRASNVCGKTKTHSLISLILF